MICPANGTRRRAVAWDATAWRPDLAGRKRVAPGAAARGGAWTGVRGCGPGLGPWAGALDWRPGLGPWTGVRG
jgi:hypothetical protein